MNIYKNFNKLSLIALGTTALTLGNVITAEAQIVQGKTTENLNLRLGPSTKDSIILTIKKGSVVEVLNYSGNWAYVKYENKYGYVSKQYIAEYTNNTTISSGGGDKNLNNNQLMECSVDSLNIRKGPSTSEQVIGNLKKGNKVEVVYHTSRGWSRIKYNQSYGYVSTKYLTNIKSDESSTTHITMQCNTDKLNIRKGPSTSEQVVGALRQGDKIDVVENLDNNWSKIKYNNGYAYVSTLYLSPVSSNNTSTNSTIMKCNARSLNVRSGPSTNDIILGNIKSGDKVEVIYKVNNDWYRIKYNDSYAYVSSHYLY